LNLTFLSPDLFDPPKMSKAHPPELKKFMDKKLGLQINGGRQIQGILRGYDPFMNLVIDEGVEKKKTGEMQQVMSGGGYSKVHYGWRGRPVDHWPS
jgi:small nuclear ribonucleoprotein G